MKRAIVAALVMSLAACAVTPQQFSAQRTSITDSDLCHTWVYAARSNDRQLERDVTAEVYRRGLNDTTCTQATAAAKQRAVDNFVGTTAVLLGAAAVIGLAAKGGGNLAGAMTPEDDTDWDWDLFYNEYRQLVWACRGVQTGQFADTQRCAYKAKADTRWPSLEAP